MASEREQSAAQNSRPLLREVMGWCAKAGAEGWYPSDHPANDRESLYESTHELLRLGFIEADWKRGRGQGFVLTELGKQKLGKPVIVPPTPVARKPVVGLTTFERGERAREAIHNPSPAWLAPGLTILFVIWYLVGAFVSANHGHMTSYLLSGDAETLEKMGGAYGPKVFAGEYWRLLTCCFVHKGFIHVLLNGYAMFVAGSLAEEIWGRRKFCIIFLLSGLAGSAFAVAWSPMALLIGASGGIWGLLLSILAWFLFNRRYLPPETVKSLFRNVGVTIIVNGMASILPGISWQAHVAGGVAGFLAACLLIHVQPGGGLRNRIALGTMVLAVIVAALAFRWSMKSGMSWEPIREQERLIRERPLQLKIKQVEDEARIASLKIPLQRIQQLHTNGAIAMANGNVAQKKAVAQQALQLKADADEIANRYGSIATLISDLRYPRTAEGAVYGADIVHPLEQTFQSISRFALQIESIMTQSQPDTRKWLALNNDLKTITESFKNPIPNTP